MKDKFKSRLMIPIFNKQGQAIGFTGRVFPWDKSDRPKYLNSSESQWFTKGDNWYGWHLAKTAIKQSKQVIIVEGNMDVIAAHCHRIQNILASQGTSVGINQVKQLRNLQVQDVLLAFDNDNAGRISATKLYLLCQSVSLNTYQVIINNQYKDLDEYLQSSQNIPNYTELKTQEYGQYLISSYTLELQSTDLITQKIAIQTILKVLAGLENQIYQEQLIKYLSQLSSISQVNLQNELAKIPKSKVFNDEGSLEPSNLGIKIQKTITPIQGMIKIAFDKLLTLELNQALNTKYKSILETLFNLLGIIFDDIKESSNLLTHITAKSRELELIKSELSAEGVWKDILSEQSQGNLIKTVINFIISNKPSYNEQDQEIINQVLIPYLYLNRGFDRS